MDDSVKAMLTSSIIIGIICAVVGTEVSFTMDVSIAGSIATTIGIALIIAVIATPKTGYIATYRRQRHLRRHYRETMMLCHIIRIWIHLLRTLKTASVPFMSI